MKLTQVSCNSERHYSTDSFWQLASLIITALLNAYSFSCRLCASSSLTRLGKHVTACMNMRSRWATKNLKYSSLLRCKRHSYLYALIKSMIWSSQNLHYEIRLIGRTRFAKWVLKPYDQSSCPRPLYQDAMHPRYIRYKLCDHIIVVNIVSEQTRCVPPTH